MIDARRTPAGWRMHEAVADPRRPPVPVFLLATLRVVAGARTPFGEEESPVLIPVSHSFHARVVIEPSFADAPLVSAFPLLDRRPDTAPC